MCEASIHSDWFPIHGLDFVQVISGNYNYEVWTLQINHYTCKYILSLVSKVFCYAVEVENFFSLCLIVTGFGKTSLIAGVRNSSYSPFSPTK